MTVSRNSACPCGSGREYERCCLAGHERAEKEARFDDAVGRRIQEWSSQVLGEEIGAVSASELERRTELLHPGGRPRRPRLGHLARSRSFRRSGAASGPGWSAPGRADRDRHHRAARGARQGSAQAAAEGDRVRGWTDRRSRLGPGRHRAARGDTASCRDHVGGAARPGYVVGRLDFGDLAELSEREVVPIEQRLDEHRSEPRRAEAVSHGLTPADESRLLGGFMTDRMRRWLDEPPNSTAARHARR